MSVEKDGEIWGLFIDDLEKLIPSKAEKTCFNCGSANLSTEDTAVICINCGVEIQNIIDEQQEWRYYGNNDGKNSTDPTRCGMPINNLLPESSLGTIILGKGYENYKKINNWNIMPYRERHLLRIFKQLQEKCDGQNISICVADKAKFMFKLLSEETVKRGKCLKGLEGACIYFSCRDKNNIRSIREIAEIFDVELKKIKNGRKQFNEIMFRNNSDYIINMPIIDAEDYIERFSILLELDNVAKERACYIAKMATALGLVIENTPQSIATTSIYIMSLIYNIDLCKKRLTEVCSISEVTIMKAYKKLVDYKRLLIPPEDTHFLEEYEIREKNEKIEEIGKKKKNSKAKPKRVHPVQDAMVIQTTLETVVPQKKIIKIKIKRQRD